MMSNHNILKGGGKVDKFLDDYRGILKDNIYFEKKYDGVIIKFKFKLEEYQPGSNDGNMYLSIPYLDDEMRKNILRNNPKFIHNPDDKKNLNDWVIELFNLESKEKKEKDKIKNQKYGFIKYKSKNGKIMSLSSKNDREKVIKDMNKEDTSDEEQQDTSDEEQQDTSDEKQEIKKKDKPKKTRKAKEKTKKNVTKKKYCKLNDNKRCVKTEKEEDEDEENCEKIEKEDGKVTCRKKKVKTEKTEKIKKPKLNCNKLLEQMKDFLSMGDYIDKDDEYYNEYLKCKEKEDTDELSKSKNRKDNEMYPLLEDPNFNSKIYQKKEFKDGNEYTERTREDIDNIEETTEKVCKNFEFELLPHQKFIKNFLSFQTPYNSLLIYHGLGTGKTCSSIGVAEEYRTYSNQMGIDKKIIVVASKYVQENYKKQLFDETKLKKVGGLWNLKSCTGNKFIKEVNPMNMMNLDREHVVKQVKRIIKDNYEFMAYLEFARQIEREITKRGINKYGDNVEQRKRKINAIKDMYSDRLIIIDEVHNIRDDPNDKSGDLAKIDAKSTTEAFQTLVQYADNLKLLLLTGTPMYNDYTEIIWLLNLMNLNDNRYSINKKDIFDKNGEITETGIEILKQKSRGYVSFVQGEDPFLFPFRVYPKDSAISYKNHSLELLTKKSLENGEIFYPEKQLNDYIIPTILDRSKGDEIGKRGIKYLDIFMTKIGSKQKEIYEDYIKHSIEKGIILKEQESFNFGILSSASQMLNICFPTEGDYKNKYGKNGLKKIMKYNQSMLSEFEYKEGYEGFFEEESLREYSGKISKIINEIKKSQGIVLIYSQYIEGGCIPIALALEEAGYNKLGGSLMKNAKPSDKGKYIMITGKKELNKDLKSTMNLCNSPENKDGSKIKVVIISLAGSEGLDFANIRQVHILDAWYNLNRTGQIEGRAIRNQSHCNLDFKMRNVLICLHGTYGLTDNKEAVDLYLYRTAEKKSELSGKVSRILKETAIDCIINENQQKLTKNSLNLNRKIILANGDEIDFNIGHSDNSQICDFMNCNYKCKPEFNKTDYKESLYTYSDKYIVLTVTKIIEIIKRLFKEKYVFEKKDLINSINARRKYKIDEIYNALSILINDKTEYIEDNIGRKGRLINIGELYLFQPLEIEMETLTTYQRRHPQSHRPESLTFELNELDKEDKQTKVDVISSFLKQLDYVFMDNKFEGDYNSWNNRPETQDTNFGLKYYYYISFIISMLNDYLGIPRENLIKYSVERLIDNLNDNFKSKLVLLNNYKKDDFYKTNNESYKENVKQIISEFFEPYIFMNGRFCVISDFNKEDNGTRGHISVVKKNDQGEYEEIEESLHMFYLKKYLAEKEKFIDIGEIAKVLIGFSSYIDESRRDDIVFRYKIMTTKRVNKGARCDNNVGNKKMLISKMDSILNIIAEDSEDKEDMMKKIKEMKEKTQFKDDYDKWEAKYIGIKPSHICFMIEYILRYFDDINKDGKKWFFNCLESILYGIPELPKIKNEYQKESVK